MAKDRTTYAIYQGDTFIFVGNATECAEFLGISRQSIKFMATPTHHARNRGGQRTLAYRVEDDDEEDNNESQIFTRQATRTNTRMGPSARA